MRINVEATPMMSLTKGRVDRQWVKYFYLPVLHSFLPVGAGRDASRVSE